MFVDFQHINMPYVISLVEAVKPLGIAYTDLSILLITFHFKEVEELLHHQIQLEEMAQILKEQDHLVNIQSTMNWNTLHGIESQGYKRDIR